MYKTKCLTAEVPRNKYDYEGGVTLFHPGLGLVRIAFGAGDNLDQDDLLKKDSQGNGIDDYMYISTYGNLHVGDFAEELEAAEEDGGLMLFSEATYSTGDIREMLGPSLDFIGWPSDIGEYVYVSSED